MLNAVEIIPVPVLDRKCAFSANLVRKIKIVCLSWNLVPSLICFFLINFIWKTCPEKLKVKQNIYDMINFDLYEAFGKLS